MPNDALIIIHDDLRRLPYVTEMDTNGVSYTIVYTVKDYSPAVHNVPTCNIESFAATCTAWRAVARAQARPWSENVPSIQ